MTKIKQIANCANTSIDVINRSYRGNVEGPTFNTGRVSSIVR